jgi:adenosylmethionine-8-amino-7-oxononanoate aminotransferase
VVREIRGKGLLRGVELMREGEPCPELGVALKKTALDNGLVMRIDPLWFAVAPALIVGKDDIDELYGLVEQSVTDALAVLD